MVEIFTQAGFSKFIEYGVFVVMCIYILFAFILTRQLKLMNRSFDTPLAGLFRMMGFLHLVAAILVAFITFIAI